MSKPAPQPTNSPKPEDFPDPGSSNQLNSNPETEQALDALFQQESATPPAAPEAEKTATEGKEEAAPAPAPEKKAAEGKEEAAPAPEGEKKAAEEPAAPAADDKKAADTSFVDVLLKKDDAAAETKPADPFDAVKLRSDASPKTTQSFEEVKRISRELVEKERKAREELETKYREAEERLKKSSELPEDVKKELEELRGFRATFDIERDPQFQQKFDARKSANYESVYSTLTKYGLPDTELAKLKGMGEQERVEAVAGLVAKLPAYEKVRIEAKLVENASIDDERSKELAAARQKADQILKEKASEAPRKQEEFIGQVTEHAKQLAGQVDVFNRVEIPADTPPAERARLEATNKNAEALQGLFVKLLADETPAGKAQAALGTVLAHAYAAQVKALREENQKLAAEIADIKKASGVGGKGIPSSAPRRTRPAPIQTFDTGQSLDRLYAETMGS